MFKVVLNGELGGKFNNFSAAFKLMADFLAEMVRSAAGEKAMQTTCWIEYRGEILGVDGCYDLAEAMGLLKQGEFQSRFGGLLPGFMLETAFSILTVMDEAKVAAEINNQIEARVATLIEEAKA